MAAWAHGAPRPGAQSPKRRRRRRAREAAASSPARAMRGMPRAPGKSAARASTASGRRRMRRMEKMTKVLRYDNVLTARVSDADFRAVCERADEEGLTRSEYLRYVARMVADDAENAKRGGVLLDGLSMRRLSRELVRWGAPLQPGRARPQLHQVRAGPRKGRPGVGVQQARRVRASARAGRRGSLRDGGRACLARRPCHSGRRLACRC